MSLTINRTTTERTRDGEYHVRAWHGTDRLPEADCFEADAEAARDTSEAMIRGATHPRLALAYPDAGMEAGTCWDMTDAVEREREAGAYQDALLRAAHRFEESHRPLVRAAFTTGHVVGCECAACIDAREESRETRRTWPGPARSQYLNGRA
jgi:hypothetical protein